MAVTQASRQQLEKIDEQIITLLVQRVNACQKIREEDEEGVNTELLESIGLWEEEAEEEGLSLPVMLQIVKLCNRLCQAAAEE